MLDYNEAYKVYANKCMRNSNINFLNVFLEISHNSFITKHPAFPEVFSTEYLIGKILNSI
jgi:hypothetical protein